MIPAKSVILFDIDTNSFDDSVPSLTHDRWDAGCAVFKSAAHNLRPVVLAVGGYIGDPRYEGPHGTAEVLDFTQPNSEWTESKINIVVLTPL